jgi:hypothetical protein
MKDRSIAVKRTLLLACWLGALGLLVPCAAEARRLPKGTAPRQAVVAESARKPDDPLPPQTTRGESKHQKKGDKRGDKRGEKMRGRQENVSCVAAFDKAKESARDSHLRESSGWFAVCSRPSCDRALRKRCAVIRTRVAALLASVVPVVTGAAERADRGVVVRMDGEILTSDLDGTAIVVDPGDHQFTFTKDGEIFATQSLTIGRGQRNQVVSASFQSPRSKEVESGEGDPSPASTVDEPAAAAALRKVPPTDVVVQSEVADEEQAPAVVHRLGRRPGNQPAGPRTGAPWSAYALAGVGLLGVGGYLTFNLKGSADNDALAVLCKPECKPISVRHVRNLYLAADVSLGIGIAALIGSTYLFLRSDRTEQDTPRGGAGRISGLGVEPTSSGALATVGGIF